MVRGSLLVWKYRWFFWIASMEVWYRNGCNVVLSSLQFTSVCSRQFEFTIWTIRVSVTTCHASWHMGLSISSPCWGYRGRCFTRDTTIQRVEEETRPNNGCFAQGFGQTPHTGSADRTNNMRDGVATPLSLPSRQVGFPQHPPNLTGVEFPEPAKPVHVVTLSSIVIRQSVSVICLRQWGMATQEETATQDETAEWILNSEWSSQLSTPKPSR